MIRCGSGGAQHRHLTVCRVDLHVHPLSARVGIDMKTYPNQNGEQFGQERNEPAPGHSFERPSLVRSFTPMQRGTSTLASCASGCASEI